MNDFEQFVARRAYHADKRLTEVMEKHGDNPNETHTYYGGQNLGYWQGLLVAYNGILDEIKEGRFK